MEYDEPGGNRAAQERRNHRCSPLQGGMKNNGVYKIAELARVSIGTVDRALHGRAGISKATREKVLRIAEKLSYSPNPAARTLSVGRSTVRIGVCVPKEIRLYYDQMRAGIADEAGRAAGLGVELIQRPVPTLGVEEKKQMTALLNRGVQGIIVTPGNPQVVGSLIDLAEEKNVRVVAPPRMHLTVPARAWSPSIRS
jgi:LacI family transcriptional regulator